jgi:hypothetical protein
MNPVPAPNVNTNATIGAMSAMYAGFRLRSDLATSTR